ncbi:MAG: hypothetical protein RIC12_01795 [Pirellulales bacterium]
MFYSSNSFGKHGLALCSSTIIAPLERSNSNEVAKDLRWRCAICQPFGNGEWRIVMFSLILANRNPRFVPVYPSDHAWTPENSSLENFFLQDGAFVYAGSNTFWSSRGQ